VGLNNFKTDESSGSSNSGNHGNRTDDKRYRNKEWMREKYEEEGLNFYEIADEVGSSYSTISKWAKRHGIDAKGAQESKYPTKDDVVEGLKRVAEEAGNDFTAREVEDIESAGLVNQCKEKFGTFNKAKEQISSEIYTSDIEKAELSVDESSKEFAYIVGVVISDGWLHKNRVGLDVTHKEFAQKFKQALSSLSGRDDINIIVKDKEESKSVNRVAMRWKKLFNILDQEYKIEEWNKWLLHLSDEQLKHYIQGIYESEGTVQESGYKVMSLDSNHMASFRYALSEYLDLPQDDFRFNCSYSASGFSNGQILSGVYIPAKHRTKFKEQINPAIKRGPEEW